MDYVVEREFKKALKGKEIWDHYDAKHHCDDDSLVLIMPTDDDILNRTAIQLLPEYLERKYYKRTLIFSEKKYIPEDIISPRILNECLSKDEMTCMVSYYRLRQFFKNIVIVSLEKPFGGGGIIGKADISLCDYVRDALYV